MQMMDERFSEEEKTLLANVQSNWQEFSNLDTQIMNLAKQGDTAAARTLMDGDGKDLYDSLLKDIAGLTEYNVSHSSSAKDVRQCSVYRYDICGGVDYGR